MKKVTDKQSKELKRILKEALEGIDKSDLPDYPSMFRRNTSKLELKTKILDMYFHRKYGEEWK